MSDSAPEVVEQAEPVEEAVIEQAVESEQPTVTEDDLDPEFARDVISVPDSSAQDGAVKLVPLAALTSTRSQLKELKSQLQTATEGSAKAQHLEAKIDDLSRQLAQLGPKAQAYDAALAAQAHQPQRQAEPEDDTDAAELAGVLDLYTAEGKPDIAKARKAMAVMGKLAKAESAQAVGPLTRHTVQQHSNIMLARAMNSAAPNGLKPDPATLKQVWSQLDPSLTATPEGAKQAWAVAMGYTAIARPAGAQPPSQATRGTDGKFVAASIPAPLHTEKAGGKESPNTLPLNDQERKYLKDSGMTEKEYLASTPPWMRR